MLTNSKMGVNAGITGSTGQIFVLTVGNVEMGLGVSVFLGKTEVNDIDLIAPLANAHQEVVGLDITMDERLGMDIFDPGNELVSQEKHRLQGEFAVAKIEQVFQAGSQEVKDHSVVVALGAKPANERNANPSSE